MCGASREHPVHEPGGRGGGVIVRAEERTTPHGVAIKPRAKNPEAPAALVFDAKVIARGAAVLAPPGALDALGAVGGNHFVQRAPPAEPQGWAVGHFRERLDRLRL